MKKSLFVAAFAGIALLFSGCAKVPQAELDAANAAIENAKVAEANVYLEAEFTALMDSMNVVNAEIETNKGKLFKSFSDVKVKLGDIEAQAAQLVEAADVKKAAIKEEVTNGLVQLQTLLDENTALVEKAPKGKEGKAAIEAIKGELDVVSAASADVTALVEAGKLLDAQAKLNAAIEKASSLNEELSTVVAKYTQKNK